MADETTRIALRKDEALLVDSFLRKYTEDDKLEPTKAESQALYNLACILEQQLPELLDPKYSEILKKAEADIFEKEEWAK
ncbi:MAG: hypothetical protein AAGJ86_06440 [Pseudomonadota bacterium]